MSLDTRPHRESVLEITAQENQKAHTTGPTLKQALLGIGVNLGGLGVVTTLRFWAGGRREGLET